MSKIAEAFQNKKAFIAYLMAGDPNLDISAQYILDAQKAGADLIEIGIPFSDPIAEGEVIQQASIRALSAGTNLEEIFKMVLSIKEKVTIPLIFMTYLNPVFVYGYDNFFKKCQEIGICGIIIPDVPLEHQKEVKIFAQKYEVEVVSMVAPTSIDRVEKIVKNAEGFIYLVSSMGVTGVRSKINSNIVSRVEEIKKITNLPVAVGFGISTPEQAKEYSQNADGIIVGSAIVNLVAKEGAKASISIRHYIESMKKAVSENNI